MKKVWQRASATSALAQFCLPSDTEKERCRIYLRLSGVIRSFRVLPARRASFSRDDSDVAPTQAWRFFCIAAATQEW